MILKQFEIYESSSSLSCPYQRLLISNILFRKDTFLFCIAIFSFALKFYIKVIWDFNPSNKIRRKGIKRNKLRNINIWKFCRGPKSKNCGRQRWNPESIYLNMSCLIPFSRKLHNCPYSSRKIFHGLNDDIRTLVVASEPQCPCCERLC